MTPRLGVNIDHVATLRQARGEEYPSVHEAARIVLENGADQITIHLREDRRHIQDTDLESVLLVTKRFGKPLNLEMGANAEITEIALATKPDWVCLVPENRQERTTEGGLDLINPENFNRVKGTVEKLRGAGIKISLFLEPDLETLRRAVELKPEAVEIHTGDYAKTFLQGNSYDHHLENYKSAEHFLKENNIACHAGHGLTDESTKPLLDLGVFEEYNIGHWIVSQAVFEGLGAVVKNFKNLFEKY